MRAREKKKRRARVRGSHYFKAAGHNKIVWSRNWKKKRKEKTKKILFFFPSIGIAAFFLTSTGAKN